MIQPRHNVEVAAPRPKAEEWVPKRTYLRKHVEFAKYGFTDECPGCESAQAGAKNRAHSENCRKRVEERMGEDNDQKKRPVDTKKRKEKYYEESDKKKRKEEETQGNEARNTEAKRDREEQCEEQAEQEEEEEPGAKRLKEEPKQEDDDMGRKDEAEKDINQMEFLGSVQRRSRQLHGAWRRATRRHRVFGATTAASNWAQNL